MTDTSNPFTTLEKQIAAWNTFVSSDDKKIDHDEAMLFTRSTSQQYLNYIHKSVELEQLRYYYVARQIAELYWQHNKAHRGKNTPGYPGHYGCRVRLRDRKFEMYWFYNEFTRKKGTEGYNVISHYLSRGDQYRYLRSTFSLAQDWEKPVIEVVEDAFAVIRRANANLMRIRQLCRWNNDNLYKMAGEIDDFKMDNPL
ncbi:conjugative transfer protein MobI(A/C) [Providencia vermicola]|uniref:conjugative transfer protein MobI(A/C) n=1 Tax=Providencia vermicola TaxID=333965 RepID=UPI0032DA2708